MSLFENLCKKKKNCLEKGYQNIWKKFPPQEKFDEYTPLKKVNSCKFPPRCDKRF